MTPMVSGHKEGDLDWSILSEAGVIDTVEKVAARASRDDIPLLSEDDLVQEAFLILATKADKAREQLEEGGPRHLGAWLRRQLLKSTATEVRRAGKQVSYEAVREAVDPDLV